MFFLKKMYVCERFFIVRWGGAWRGVLAGLEEPRAFGSDGMNQRMQSGHGRIIATTCSKHAKNHVEELRTERVDE